MKQYKIYTSPHGAMEAIKQGWSWPAFFFGCIWACVKKMWALGLGVLVAFLVIGLLFGLAGADESISNSIVNLLAIVTAIVFGRQGNAWREKYLLSRGFILGGTVSAANQAGALALHTSPRQ